MTIFVHRVRDQPPRQTVIVRGNAITVDCPQEHSGNIDVPTAHDLYDAALGACEAITVEMYAQRKGFPLEDVEVTVNRDASAERQGRYVLDTTLRLGGDLSDDQRRELLAVASRCPLQKLMTTVTTVINTKLA